MEVGDNVPRRTLPICCSIPKTRLVPPTTAAEQSPDRRLLQARWRAYIVLEQAVSTVKLSAVLVSSFPFKQATWLGGSGFEDGEQKKGGEKFKTDLPGAF